MRKQKPLKPLNQEEYKMKILQDLGMKKPTENYYKKVRMAEFECMECKQPFEAVVATKAKNQKYCRKCIATDLKKPNRNHPLYKAWAGTKCKISRTDQERTKAIYFDRNITMCDGWLNSFDTFFEWAISNGWKKGLTIDRIDNEKGYSPGNCRWASYSTQSANQRRLDKGVTGYIGVQVNLGRDKKPNGNFRAMLKWKNITYGLGNSKDKLYLAKMYDSFIDKHNLPHTKNNVLSENEYVPPTSKNISKILEENPIIL